MIGPKQRNCEAVLKVTICKGEMKRISSNAGSIKIRAPLLVRGLTARLSGLAEVVSPAPDVGAAASLFQVSTAFSESLRHQPCSYSHPFAPFYFVNLEMHRFCELSAASWV